LFIPQGYIKDNENILKRKQKTPPVIRKWDYKYNFIISIGSNPISLILNSLFKRSPVKEVVPPILVSIPFAQEL
jgi:hypothetical protein